MENLELINDFVEGELSAESEELLFSTLASSPEARIELKSMMAMKEAIKSDTKAFTPSAKSTVAIFTSLGFTPPVPAPAPISFLGRMKEMFALHSKPIITGLSSAGLTAAVFLLLMNSPFGKNEMLNSGNSKSIEPTLPMIHNLPGTIPLSESRASEPNQLPTVAQKEKIVYKYIVLADTNSQKATVLASNELQAENNSIEPISEAPSLPSYDVKVLSSLANTSDLVPVMEIHSSQRFRNPEELFTQLANTNFRVELSGSQYWSSVKEKTSPGENQSLNNSGLTLLYSASDEIALGLDYRRENFYQKFEGIEKNGLRGESMYYYEQNPNFETAGIVFRYLPSYARVAWLKPFVQTNAAANKVGFVGRFMFGAELSPFHNYSLVVGYDWSNLSYSHQNKWYNSTKRGLHLGAAVKF